MHHHIRSVAQTKWTMSDDVKDWSRDDVEDWWRTLGPNANRYIGMVQRRVLNGERLIKMKRKDFDAEGMESWLAKSFVQWVRDLKYNSADPVPTQEVADIICANTKFGPNVAMLIARFVRDNPEHWDRKELSKYFKKRGLKKIAKRVKKEKISAENVSILISDPKIAQHERDELQFLFPHLCFYTRRNPNPTSWYAIVRDYGAAYLVLFIAFLTIASVLLGRGINENSSDRAAFVAIGAIIYFIFISICLICAFHPDCWREPCGLPKCFNERK